MKELGIGVVGCGFVGRGAHVPSFANIDGARLVAIADADEKRRNKAATKHKVEASYDDYRKLVADPNVDAVIVALPTALHVPASLLRPAVRLMSRALPEPPVTSALLDLLELDLLAKENATELLAGRRPRRFTETLDHLPQVTAGRFLAIIFGRQDRREAGVEIRG